VRTVLALLRASWYQARSYRLSIVMQFGGLLLTVFPLYLVTGALQPTMAQTIAAEADQLFAFVLVGSIAIMLVSASMSSLSGAIASGISSGYFESLLMTRASVPSLLVGLTSYNFTLTLLRASFMVTVGWLIGATIVWANLLPALFILALLVVAHFGIGLVAAALVTAFRTAGPLTTFVTLLSTFFGGVYYPVSQIPSWLGVIAKVTPMAYGLSALRKVLLQGEGLGSVAGDLAILASIAVVLLGLGALAMQWALSYAKRAGSLGAY
jgi:ABC-2 type transport system permease protein